MTGSASALDRPVALAEAHLGAPDLKPLDSPMAWEGSQFVDKDSFVFHLTPADSAEIDTALASFQG